MEQSAHANRYVKKAGRLMGKAYVQQCDKDYPAAGKTLQKAKDLLEKKGFPRVDTMAYVLHNLSIIHKLLGEEETIEPLLKQALSILEECYGTDSPQTLMIYGSLAEFYHRQQRYIEEETLLKRMAEIDAAYWGEQNRTVAVQLIKLAKLYTVIDRFEDADACLQRARQIAEASHAREQRESGVLGLIQQSIDALEEKRSEKSGN